MPMLEVKELSVRYGGLVALDSISLEVPQGTLVGLIGPNGAGKTTAIDAITGLCPSRGEVLLAGSRIDSLRAHRRAQLGMLRTFQSLELFEDLSIRENLVISAVNEPAWRAIPNLVWPRTRKHDTSGVDEALSDLDLQHFAEAKPTELSHGQRKLVGVARALAAKPKLVLLDEPAAGLDSTESEEFGTRIRRMVDGGISALLIEHDVELVFRICDYVYVLDFGKIIAHGAPESVRKDASVVAAYLGVTTEASVDELDLELEAYGMAASQTDSSNHRKTPS